MNRPEYPQNLAIGPRQSPGIEIAEEGGSVKKTQPPSSATQSRELSRGPNGQILKVLGSRPIGIFDSGLGGLTVLREIRRFLPNENILYRADTAHLPYGDKSPEEIRHHTLDNIHFFLTQGVKFLIIACNTACSATFPTLRTHCPLPIITIVEQGIEELIRHHLHQTVALLATTATIHSQIYERLLVSHPIKLLPIACPALVPLIENNIHDEAALRAAIPSLPPADALFLGCSHYPLIAPLIADIAKVPLIDPARATAQETVRLLKANNLLNPSSKPGTTTFSLTGETYEKYSKNPAFAYLLR